MIWRVRDREAFLALRRAGRRGRAGPLTVTFLSGPSGAAPRVAFAVGRGVGGAVERNLLRRRLRHAARDLARLGELPGGAYLIAATPAAATLPFAELEGRLAEAVHAARPSVP